MEFIGDGVPLGENKMTDKSDVSGWMSGKIRSVRTSENTDDRTRGGGEGEGGGMIFDAFR